MKLIRFSNGDPSDDAIVFVEDSFSNEERFGLKETLKEMLGGSHKVVDEIEITGTKGDKSLDNIIEMNTIYLRCQ